MKTSADISRFWDKVDRTGECWIWQACITTNGYGQFRTDAGITGAHRVAYELTHGQIANGLHLDHLCRNRACVRPSHLEPVEQGENTLRGENFVAVNARKTHCINGHEFSFENTLTTRGRRECRACNRERMKAKNAKRRAKQRLAS